MTLTYEWMEGGFFLIARGDTQHVEIIGYDHEAGAEPALVMTSRLYRNRGDTLSYTHEVDGKRRDHLVWPEGFAGVVQGSVD